MAQESLAENIFGKTNKVSEGNRIFLPSREVLERGFESRKSATQAFCKTCGAYWEVDIRGARKLAKLAGVDLPRHGLSNHYFMISGCEDCVGRESRAVLRAIKDLPKPIKKSLF
jgi:hypothetical protein